MLESFLFSANTIIPIFLVTVLGGLLKKFKFLDDNFFSQSEKFVFKVALPAMLFIEISTADGAEIFDGAFIGLCVVGIIVSFIIPCLIVPLIIKQNDKRGAFIQGVYRSNFAILGVTLADNMFGDEGVQQIAMVLPFAIVLFNFFAVTILSIFGPAEKKLSPMQLAKVLAKNIFTNPLIISVVLALPFLLFEISLPKFINTSLVYLKNSTMPLSLLALGASFSFDSLKSRFGLAISATVCKTVVLPAIMLAAAILLGYRGPQLGVVLILFGGPAAVSSYIMAKNMESDYELAGQILLFTTLLCTFTLFGAIFLLKYFALI